MSKPDSDRNLLVGILALQLSLVNEQQLLVAVKAWAFDKSKLLEDLFLEQRAIDEQARAMLSSLVQRSSKATHVEVADTQDAAPDPRGRHESLPTVLAAVRKLSDINDAEVQDSVADFLNGRDRGSINNSDQPTTAFNKAERGNRFRIVSNVAEGGLGRVSLAEDLELHREVALKEILPKYRMNEETRLRFLLEAEVTGRLEHPGIVPVYSLGSSHEGGPYYAMQFIRGISLAEAIRQLHRDNPKLDAHTKRLEMRKLVGRLVTACQAVHYAHIKGVLHRDIKPQNIMLGKFGETFVVDWGLARVNKADPRFQDVTTDESILVPSGSGSAATRLGAMIGTLEYMSPEQADGRLEDMGPSADVFSLGATLYCILTGSPPVSNEIKKERSRLDYGHFLKPSQINRELPPALDAICLKALATESSDRYQSAAELVDELEAWLADEPVAAYAEPISDRVRRWLKQHRTWAASGAGAIVTSLVALIGLLIVFSYYNRDLTEARDKAVQNETVARSLLSRELRIDQELLGRNELTALEIAQLRMRLAEGTYQQYETWFKRNPQDRNLRAEFAFVARALSNLNRSISRFGKASSYIKASLEAQESIPVDQKSDEEKYDFVLTSRDASDLEFLDGRMGNALLFANKAQQVLRLTSTDSPDKASYDRTLADVQSLRARALLELGIYDEALKEAEQANGSLQVLLKSVDSPSEVPTLVLQLASTRTRILNESGRSSEALAVADEGISAMQSFLKNARRDAMYAFVSLLNLAAEIRINRDIEVDRAAQLLTEADQMLAEQLKKEKTALLSVCYSTTERLRAKLLRKQGQLAAAQRAASNAQSEAQGVVSKLPLVDHLIVQADAEIELSEMARALGEPDKASQLLATARDLLQKAAAKSPDCTRVRSKLKRLENTMEK